MVNDDYSWEIRKAIRHYWRSKSSALTRNQSGVRIDQGNRGAATAGKNFDGFIEMFAKLAKKHGVKGLEIHSNRTEVVLPGHFRSSKQWDLVLIFRERLIATLEFKALGGPSFGNNANNRCEEALGSGVDLAVTQREGRLGAGANPFVGYCILVEEAEASARAPRRGNPSPHFESDPAFESASYQQRMQILCELQIQSEGAEVEYKRIKVRPLEGLPPVLVHKTRL